MFQRVVHRPESESALTTERTACERRIRFSVVSMLALGGLVIAGLILRVASPDLIGSFGTKLLSGVTAVLVAQAIDFAYWWQRLSRLKNKKR